MENFGMSMLYFWSAYVIVTCIGILHTIFNIKVLGMGCMDGKSMGEGYERTKPWHPIYNIVIFSIFGFLYVKGLPEPSFAEVLSTGAVWTAVCTVFDLFGWVIVRHPWSLTLKEFYIEYQPWLTLIYIAIFLGPIIGYLILIL